MGNTGHVDEMPQVGGFFVDISGYAPDDKSPETAWTSKQGGDESSAVCENRHGSDGPRSKTLGRLECSDLVLEGPITPKRKAMVNWFNDSAKEEKIRQSISIIPCDLQGKAISGSQIDYKECFIISYEVDSLEADNDEVCYERVTICVEQSEKK